MRRKVWLIGSIAKPLNPPEEGEFPDGGVEQFAVLWIGDTGGANSRPLLLFSGVENLGDTFCTVELFFGVWVFSSVGRFSSSLGCEANPLTHDADLSVIEPLWSFFDVVKLGIVQDVLNNQQSKAFVSQQRTIKRFTYVVFVNNRWLYPWQRGETITHSCNECLARAGVQKEDIIQCARTRFFQTATCPASQFFFKRNGKITI